MVEQLSHQVHELESERRKTDVKVQDLEHQVHTMTTRLTDYRAQYEVNLPQIYNKIHNIITLDCKPHNTAIAQQWYKTGWKSTFIYAFMQALFTLLCVKLSS